MKLYYATLPCGTPVKIPEDTLQDFYVLHRGVPVRSTPDGDVGQRSESRVLNTLQCGFESHHPHQYSRRGPKEARREPS